MRLYFCFFILLCTTCRSVELKQVVSYFRPITIRPGTDISAISKQLNFDTTEFEMVGYAKHLKRFSLTRSDLDKLNFYNNFADSLELYFHENKLFSINVYATGNRSTEYLKFDIKGRKESSLGLGGFVTNDTTFNYGKYHELRYNSTDGHILYEYSENLVDNTARLTITNGKMLKLRQVN